MNKSFLLKLIKLMFGLLFAAFAYVLVVGIGTRATGELDGTGQQFANLPAGQSRLVRVSGDRVWITRLSEEQRSQLKGLTEELSNPNGGCGISAKLCGVLSKTSQSGIDLSFSSKPPPQLPSHYAWQGGFVDPTTGATFDLLGRTFKLDRESDSQQLKVIEF